MVSAIRAVGCLYRLLFSNDLSYDDRVRQTPMTTFNWRLKGRCYHLGHDVPHPGGVVPNRLIVAREMDPQKIIPHLFEETDPGFHERAKPGDIIVTGRNFGMGP